MSRKNKINTINIISILIKDNNEVKYLVILIIIYIIEFIFSGKDRIAPFPCLDIGQCTWKVLSEIFISVKNRVGKRHERHNFSCKGN